MNQLNELNFAYRIRLLYWINFYEWPPNVLCKLDLKYLKYSKYFNKNEKLFELI